MQRLAIVVGLVTLCGCSLVNDPGRHQGGESETDGGGPDAGPATIPAAELCGVMARLACESRNECCPAGPVPDLDECIDNARRQCESELEPIFTEDKTGYSPERAAEVVQDARELAAECDPAIVEWYVFDVISVMQGTAERGQACTPSPSPEEDPASFFSCRRDKELVCRPEEGVFGPWKCQGISPEGGECAIIQHCRRDSQLYCEIPPLSTIGSCEPRRSNGSTCTEALQCESLFCDSSDTCASADENVYCVPLEDFYADQMSG